VSAYGPRQHGEAKVWAQQIWGWSMDLLEATTDNDVERVTKLTTAIAEATAALQALTARASR
jgi:hypothetical protein